MIFSKNGQKCTKIYQKEGNILTIFDKGIVICVTMVGVNLYNVQQIFKWLQIWLGGQAELSVWQNLYDIILDITFVLISASV